MHFTLGSREGGVSGDEGRSRRSTKGQRLRVRPLRGGGGSHYIAKWDAAPHWTRCNGRKLAVEKERTDSLSQTLQPVSASNVASGLHHQPRDGRLTCLHL